MQTQRKDAGGGTLGIFDRLSEINQCSGSDTRWPVKKLAYCFVQIRCDVTVSGVQVQVQFIFLRIEQQIYSKRWYLQSRIIRKYAIEITE